MFNSLLLFLSLALAGVNVNTASQSELEGLPGIGPSKAAAIISYRDAHGPFSGLEQLDEVPGIGPSTLQNIQSQVEFGPGGSTPPTAPLSDPSPSTAPRAPAASSSSPGAVDINHASADELQAMPGIGPAKADAIVADRDAHGPFDSCAELTRVQGIGEATVLTIGSACRAE